jgi:hypothetical protein
MNRNAGGIRLYSIKSDERETLFKGFPTQVFAMSQERWKKIGGA